MYTGELIDLTTVYDDQDVIHTEVQHVKNQFIDTTVGRVILNDHLPKDMPFINGLLRKKGLQNLVQYCYLRFGLEKTVEMLDDIKDLGFLYATRAGISIGIDDLVVPEDKEKLVAARAEGSDGRREAVPGRRHHQRRALQQGHRHLVHGHREGRGRDVQGHGEDGPGRRRLQPDLHHGRLRRPRIEAADPPARRHARPDGAAVRRDHREPHHLELPRRPQRAAVLHLDARRPQGPGRHRAQDRRLRLPDAPPGRRRPGRDHLRERLRHRGRHRHRADHRVGRGHRAAARPHRRPRQPRGHQGPVRRQRHRQGERGDHRRDGQRVQAAGIEKVRIRSVLTCESQARRLRPVLRPRPGHRQAGRARHGGRRHRRAVDRRARHPADDAHVPHRRHRQPRAPSRRRSRPRTPAPSSSTT